MVRLLCIFYLLLEILVLFSCGLTDVGIYRVARKTVALLYLLLVALFQCSVCGANGLRRIAARSIDSLPSLSENCSCPHKRKHSVGTGWALIGSGRLQIHSVCMYHLSNRSWCRCEVCGLAPSSQPAGIGKQG